MQARRDLNNIEDGFYISPAFLDKLSIHVAKNFLDLPKIKVPLILGRSLTADASGQHTVRLSSIPTADLPSQSCHAHGKLVVKKPAHTASASEGHRRQKTS